VAKPAVKPVYALVGPDAYLQSEKLAEISASLPDDAQKINVDGERAELSDVLDELRSFAMFGGTKVVVVRNGEDFVSRWRDGLESYLEEPSTQATLVLRMASLPKNQRIYKLIQKVGHIEPCEPPKQSELPGWIVKRAKGEYKFAITQAAASLLAELIGDDVGRLVSEISKLSLLDKPTVDVADIDKSVAFQREQEMWDMTNAVAAGRTDEALRRWRHLIHLDPSTEFRAVTWLALWLEDARKVVLARREGRNAMSALPPYKYRDPKLKAAFIQTAEQMGEKGVARAIDLLTQVDRQSKTGIGDAAQNVERFLIAIGAR
jgi:DNA polymerase III delta subunit